MSTTRPARRGDADALGAVHVATWRSAYAGLLPDTLLQGLSVERSTDRWRALLPCTPPASCLVAVDAADRLGGFCYAGPDRDGAGPEVAELCSLYVLPAAGGAGLGTALLARTEEVLREQGFHRGRLWVLGTNHHARQFYGRRGWAPDGRRRVVGREGADLPEVGYARVLVATAPTRRAV